MERRDNSDTLERLRPLPRIGGCPRTAKLFALSLVPSHVSGAPLSSRLTYRSHHALWVNRYSETGHRSATLPGSLMGEAHDSSSRTLPSERHILVPAVFSRASGLRKVRLALSVAVGTLISRRRSPRIGTSTRPRVPAVCRCRPKRRRVDAERRKWFTGPSSEPSRDLSANSWSNEVLFGADRFEFLVFLGYDANFNGDEPIRSWFDAWRGPRYPLNYAHTPQPGAALSNMFGCSEA